MLPALFHPTVQISPAVGFKTLTFEKHLQKKFLFCTSNLFALQTSSLLCVPQQNAIVKSFTLVGQCYH